LTSSLDILGHHTLDKAVLAERFGLGALLRKDCPECLPAENAALVFFDCEFFWNPKVSIGSEKLRRRSRKDRREGRGRSQAPIKLRVINPQRFSEMGRGNYNGIRLSSFRAAAARWACWWAKDLRNLAQQTWASLLKNRIVLTTGNHADFEEDETGTFALHFSESVKNLS